jgi:hypothetical protein
MVIKGRCEAMVHGNQAILDVHHDWVVFQVDIVNTFNSISRKTIF